MAGIIKNQILKHLSRFVKNLSSDRINVSTLKGEGELTNLELEEETLTELLALPIWMRIKYAHCNRARIMIQWTKLKSVPIRLILDHVEIQIEACEELRPVIPIQSSQVNLGAMGKYGFVTKVVDGITVIVESVDIVFYSKAFESKVQISRIQVESRSPKWKKVELTHTRLKDVEKGEVLTFKEIEWQTLRLEAQSTSERHLAPLRLLTNLARARIVIKKKLSDCSVVGCRLSLFLDDLLWVLTDSQIRAAMHFADSLSGLIKLATETAQNVKAARKLETLPHRQTQKNHDARLRESEAARNFDAFDVKETSYHLNCEKIDFHFCDDPGGRSSHPDLKEGGAMQVNLKQFMVDFYPYHPAKADRRHWHKYGDNELSHWLEDSLQYFRQELLRALNPESLRGPGADRSKAHLPESSAENNFPAKIEEQLGILMSTCIILKIRDLSLYKVTTSHRETPLPFLSSYLDRPKDITSVHVEFTWFYYPGGVCFPLPSPKLYVQTHPLQVNLDVCTILWLNSFISNIQNSVLNSDTPEEAGYVDMRVEVIMPKIVIEDKRFISKPNERPQSLQLQAARVIVSNYRSNETGTKMQLKGAVKNFNNIAHSSAAVLPDKFNQHAEGLDDIKTRPEIAVYTFQEICRHLTTDFLWTEARDVWFIHVDPVWADFCVESKSKANVIDVKSKLRPASTIPIPIQSELVFHPFLDSVPIQVWLFAEEDKTVTKKDSLIHAKRNNINAFLHVDRMCNVQLTHHQYLFLLRTVEAVSEMSIFLTMDTRRTVKFSVRDDSSSIFAHLPCIEVSFIQSVVSEPAEESSANLELQSALSATAENEHQPVCRRELTKDWTYTDTQKTPFYNVSAPESPKHYYTENNLSNPGGTTVDPSKSSLTQGFKQGISSLVVSFSKVGGESTPDSEVTSMWSASDSSENNFVHLDSPDNELESNPFRDEDAVESVEVAEEVIEDESPSTGSFSMHNPFLKEDTAEVNVLSVCLNGIKVKQCSEGLISEAILSCRSIELLELVSVGWREFQSIFSARSKKWKEEHIELFKSKQESKKIAINLEFSQTVDENVFEECLNSFGMQNAISEAKKTPVPRINLLDNPSPGSPIRQAIKKSSHPSIKAQIDLRSEHGSPEQFITMHTSVLKGLAEFFEDEIPPVVFPLEIAILGINFELIEDTTLPGKPPTKVSVPDALTVCRDNSGVFIIGSKSNCDEHLEQYSSANPVFNSATLEELHSHKRKNLELELEFADMKRKILELKQQVNTLREEKSDLIHQLQVNKDKKQII